MNTGNLDKINQLLPPGVRAFYELVTPKGATLRIIIPNAYFTEEARGTEQDCPSFSLPCRREYTVPAPIRLTGYIAPGTVFSFVMLIIYIAKDDFRVRS